MIEGYEKFTYIGYTFGGDKPTFYFKEGRYTQQHKHKDNEGWHPRRKFYRGVNIQATEASRFTDMRAKKDKAGMVKFGEEFMKGTYDSAEPSARLFECSSNDEKNWHYHP